jgi:hypothetical protein
MNSDEKQKIIKILEDKGATNPCPRCGENNFAIIDGYFNQTLQEEIVGDIVLGGPAIPSIVTACTNCGFISQHALGALGLLPSSKKGDKK